MARPKLEAGMCRSLISRAPSGERIMKSRTIVNCRKASSATMKTWYAVSLPGAGGGAAAAVGAGVAGGVGADSGGDMGASFWFQSLEDERQGLLEDRVVEHEAFGPRHPPPVHVKFE